MASRTRRLPPHNVDAERALLGALFCSAGAVQTALASDLTAADFYPPAHQHVFAAVSELVRIGASVDVVTVAEELRRVDLLDQVGGAEALLAMQHDTPAVSHVGRYIAIVTTTAQLRRVISVASTVMDAAYSETNDVDALLADAHEQFHAIATTNGAVNPFMERLVRGTDAAVALMPPRPLVDGLLFVPSVAVLYGAPKTGKSVVALDLALHVAASRAFWHGRAVTGGRVLYVTGEGVGGLPQRVAAWLKHHGRSQVDAIAWLTVAPNLLDAVQVDRLAAVVADFQPVLVVIDTLARSMVGGDENTARDMGEAVAAAERLRDVGGCCVLIVHHVGKNVDAGMRGHSSLLGGVDTTIELTGDQHAIRVKVAAQKDAVAADPWWVRLDQVGDSVVAVRADAAEVTSDAAVDVLGALRETAAVDGEWVSRSRWAGAVQLSPRSFARAVGWLLDNRIVERDQQGRIALFRLAHVVAKDAGR